MYKLIPFEQNWVKNNKKLNNQLKLKIKNEQKFIHQYIVVIISL